MYALSNLPTLGQCRQHERCAEETRGHSALRVIHELGQGRADGLAILIRGDPQLEGDRAPGLGSDDVLRQRSQVSAAIRSARAPKASLAAGSPMTLAASPSSRALQEKNAFAMKSESHLASHGRSGGASGSSQSPNCHEGTSSPSGPRRRSSDSTQRSMLGNCRRRISGSP